MGIVNSHKEQRARDGWGNNGKKTRERIKRLSGPCVVIYDREKDKDKSGAASNARPRD